MAIGLYVGYLKMVLSSITLLEFPVSWSADDLSGWVNSDLIYSTLCGIAGLLFYGIAFPFWFLFNLGNYYIVAYNDDQIGDSVVGRDIKIATERRKRHIIRKQTKRKKELFLTLGVFPTSLRSRAWWWPGLSLLRKFILAVLLAIFQDSSFLLLMIFLLSFLVTLIAQQCFSPLVKESNRKWYHTSVVDIVLQLCLVLIVGVSFLSFWSTIEDKKKESSQKWMEDVFFVCIFIPSIIYLCLAIGVSCGQPEPHFFEVAASGIVNNNIASDERDKSSNNYGGGSILSIKQSFSTQSASSQGSSQLSKPQKEIEFIGDIHAAEWKQTADYDEWVATGAPSVIEGHGYDKKFAKEQEDPNIAIHDDIDINIEGFVDDDLETVYEEIWIDEATGEQISDKRSGNWLDAVTGERAIPPDHQYK